MYRTVDSKCCEFGYELLSVLPLAYNQYINGQLDATISAFDTKCFYFFSPNHTEVNVKRSWDSVLELKRENFPNIDIHKSELDWSKFTPPPLKDYYQDKKITFDRETIVIFNRYNNEWGKDPINFLDTKTLDTLFNMMSGKYQIVYLNLNHDDRYYDHLPPLEFNDKDVLLKYPNVLTFTKLFNMYPGLSLNELQLRVFAGCSKFISSNGGQLIMSAYFGGENIIFSKKTRELDPNVNSFYRWYHKLGGGIFSHVNNYQSLIDLVKHKWVDNKPIVNILIRTSGRPKFFKKCIESIYSQDYKNVNIIVGVDDHESKKYVQPEKCRMIEYNYNNYHFDIKPIGIEYGNEFIPNLYMNDLKKEVVRGFILYLDDDDQFVTDSSLSKIMNNITSDDEMVFWIVKFPHRTVPNVKLLGHEPQLTQVDTAGFIYHHKYTVNWEPYTNGDYRVCKQLYNIVPIKKYISEVLVESLRDVRNGRGLKDDYTEPKIEKKTSNEVKVKISSRKEVIKNNKPLITNVTGRIDRTNNPVEKMVLSEGVSNKKIKPDITTTKLNKPNDKSISNTSKQFLKVLPNRRLNLPVINLGKKSK
jgi:hypothetical protein